MHPSASHRWDRGPSRRPTGGAAVIPVIDEAAVSIALRAITRKNYLSRVSGRQNLFRRDEHGHGVGLAGTGIPSSCSVTGEAVAVLYPWCRSDVR